MDNSFPQNWMDQRWEFIKLNSYWKFQIETLNLNALKRSFIQDKCQLLIFVKHLFLIH